jgi:hypothetical protein
MNPCNATALQPQTSCTFVVTFAPTTAVLHTAQIAISSSESVQSTSLTVNGTGLTAGLLAFEPTSLTFADVQPTAASGGTLPFTLKNNGMSPTTLTALSTVGIDATQFLLAPNSCALVNGMLVLAGGGSCSGSVTFTPLMAAGTRSATLVAVYGSGQQASATLTGKRLAPAKLAFDGTPPSSFGNVTTGQSSTLTFTVQNIGEVPSTALTVSLQNGMPTQAFMLNSDTCSGAVLSSTGRCTFTVTFSPTVAMPQTVGVQVAMAGDPANPLTQALSGTGVQPGMLAFSQNPVSFSSTVVGSTSASQRLTLTNSGGTAITLSAVSLKGSDAGHFSLTGGTCPFGAATAVTLGPGGSCTIDVVFSPTTDGAKSASLEALAGGITLATTSLTGTGLRPARLEFVAPAQADFGKVTIDTSQSLTLKIKNSGQAASGSLSLSLSAAAPFVIDSASGATGCAPGVALAAGAECDVKVSFRPTALQLSMVTLTVGASPGGSITASLTGTGVFLDVEPVAYDFGNQSIGSTTDVAFKVTNPGTASIDISAHPSTNIGTHFSVTSEQCTGALGALAACEVSVAFRPSTVGAVSDALVVKGTPSGASTQYAVQVNLTGTGRMDSSTSDMGPGGGFDMSGTPDMSDPCSGGGTSVSLCGCRNQVCCAGMVCFQGMCTTSMNTAGGVILLCQGL